MSEVSIEGLSEAGRELWDAIGSERSISRSLRLTVLNACRIADNLERISKRLADEGLISVNSRGDEVANPLLVEHRMQLATLRQVLSSLGIDKLVTVSSGPAFADQLAKAREAREARAKAGGE